MSLMHIYEIKAITLLSNNLYYFDISFQTQKMLMFFLGLLINLLVGSLILQFPLAGMWTFKILLQWWWLTRTTVTCRHFLLLHLLPSTRTSPHQPTTNTITSITTIIMLVLRKASIFNKRRATLPFQKTDVRIWKFSNLWNQQIQCCQKTRRAGVSEVQKMDRWGNWA